MTFKQTGCALLALFVLTGCEGVGPKQGIGTLGGGAAGGLLGAQFGKGSGQLAATAAGTIIGAWLGNGIGVSLDRADQMYRGQAMQTAFTAPIGQSVPWQNSQSGNYGFVQPVREGMATDGRYCREFSQTIYVGGRPEKGFGSACQQPDGSWRILG